MRPLLTAIVPVILSIAAAPAAVDFAHEVLPILKEHCVECHTNGKYKGSLSLDTRDALIGSDDAVVVGDASKSLFIELLSAEDPDDRMPQKADALSAEKIAILTKWINEGLAWEPGFTFKEKTWAAPLHPRKPELPPARGTLTNPIDRIALAYFEANKVTPPESISDSAFIRRVSMDLIGLLPSPQELAEFESNNDRPQKIVELLARDLDYADHWMTFWNDLLRNDYTGTGFIDGGRKQVTGWLYQALKENKPYDQFVRELMSPTPESEGFINGIKWRGSVNASQVQEVQYAQNVSQVFFGENLKCASCHDSFIDDWKLEDAYGMAAIIAGKPLEMYRCDKPTGQFADAKFLFDALGVIDKSAAKPERLKRAAELATTKENGRLARTIVNRLWARLMGRGLVEPVDMMGNRPWSEDMLDFLAWDLAENAYDLKHTLTLITTSRLYQSATVNPPKEAEDFVFNGPIAKRMTAEQFIDAVWDITGTAPGKIEAGVNRGTAAAGATAPGQWIWSAEGSRPVGESVVFTREFTLPNKIGSASLVITCDNEYAVSINGKRVGSDANWENVERFEIANLLKPGSNIIQVDGKNLGNAPNAAGLYVYLHVNTAAESIILTTDKNWKADGKEPVTIDPGIWGAPIQEQITAQLPRAVDSNQPRPLSVRASLVNSTMLMRALGRPNREQVVTTRPEDLTTLQALELNNGAEFVDYLNRGAERLLGQDDIVRQLYLSALSRPPGADEIAVAHEILGASMTKESAADLLWTVLMLPEFQFVR